jgi:quinol monooxygenase YgiN
MTESVTIIATQHAKPERLEDLKLQIRRLVDAARTEDGCLDYRVLVSDEQPYQFHFVERWTSRQALDAHFHTATFQAFWTERMEYLESEVDIVVAADFI